MNKPELTESGLPISGLLRQAIAFVRDFAAFAGPRGVMASVLAVLAASFDGVGLLLLVPLLSHHRVRQRRRMDAQIPPVAVARPICSARCHPGDHRYPPQACWRRSKWALSKWSAPASPAGSLPRHDRWCRACSTRA
jgi:hypothetical protein